MLASLSSQCAFSPSQQNRLAKNRTSTTKSVNTWSRPASTQLNAHACASSSSAFRSPLDPTLIFIPLPNPPLNSLLRALLGTMRLMPRPRNAPSVKSRSFPSLLDSAWLPRSGVGSCVGTADPSRGLSSLERPLNTSLVETGTLLAVLGLTLSPSSSESDSSSSLDSAENCHSLSDVRRLSED